jgi:hypothetical protein
MKGKASILWRDSPSRVGSAWRDMPNTLSTSSEFSLLFLLCCFLLSLSSDADMKLKAFRGFGGIYAQSSKQPDFNIYPGQVQNLPLIVVESATSVCFEVPNPTSLTFITPTFIKTHPEANTHR